MGVDEAYNDVDVTKLVVNFLKDTFVLKLFAKGPLLKYSCRSN